MEDKGLLVTLEFIVEGKEGYENKSTWRNLPPAKVAILDKILMAGQAEFIKQASKF